MTTKIDFPPGIHIEFDYQNWNGEEHSYKIALESIEFGPYHAAGRHDRQTSREQWVMHGFCVERDQEERDGQPRRTFLMQAMREVRAA